VQNGVGRFARKTIIPMATPPDLSFNALMGLVVILWNWAIPTAAIIIGSSIGAHILIYLAREMNKLKLIR
jgi:hypothetical protein